MLDNTTAPAEQTARSGTAPARRGLQTPAPKDVAMTTEEQYHAIPRDGDERATLDAFLDWQRATFEWKCTGVGDDDMRRATAPPSTLTLLGLLRHMADVERGWFRRTIAGESAPDRWVSAADPDADFNAVADADVGAAWAAWREEVAAAREIASARGLDDLGSQRDGRPVSLRWVMVHLIEEYSRHNGHADLIREALDGVTGYSA